MRLAVFDSLRASPYRIVYDMGHGVTMECDHSLGWAPDDVAHRWIARFLMLWEERTQPHIMILDDGQRQVVTPVMEA